MPKNLFAAEKVFGAISGATSSPIAQYISSPTTFLHNVDPRIKMVYFLLFNFFVNTSREFDFVGKNFSKNCIFVLLSSGSLLYFILFYLLL